MGLGAGLLVAASVVPAAAQESIITDRPVFTKNTATVMPGAFQLEAGYTFFRVGNTDLHQIGEALLRIGLIPGLEGRVLLPSFMSASTAGPLIESDVSGISDANLGMKLGLYESGVSEGLPSLSLLLGTGVPIGDDDFGAEGWEPEAKLLLGWSLTGRLGLAANVNYAQRDPEFGDRYDELGASVSLGFPLTQRLSGFGEYFAIRPDIRGGAGDRDYLDAGITFLVSDDFQLDARIGVGVDSPEEDDFFVGAGVSKRF